MSAWYFGKSARYVVSWKGSGFDIAARQVLLVWSWKIVCASEDLWIHSIGEDKRTISSNEP